MNKILLVLFFLTINILHSQTIEDKLEIISTKIALKLSKKTNYQIAVYPFTYLKSKEENLALHFFDEFQISLKSKERNFSVMDRETLETYLAEHELNSNGLIDPQTAKQFGKLIAADAYVSGKVYVFGSVIKLSVKVTDTQTGEIISFISEKLPINYDLAQFLDIKNWEEKREKAEENKSQNPDCNTLNVGDYCFFNNTPRSHEIVLNNSNNFYGSNGQKKIKLIPYSKACFKDLSAKTYQYKIRRTDRANIAGQTNIVSQGNFVIKKCESRLQNISSTNSSKGSTGKIIKTSSAKLYTITITNPNYYSRKLIFSNKRNETETISVAANSKATIALPFGFYRFTSQTTFTIYTVEKSSFNLKADKNIILAKDHKN